jgi:hypothetical protein
MDDRHILKANEKGGIVMLNDEYLVINVIAQLPGHVSMRRKICDKSQEASG